MAVQGVIGGGAVSDTVGGAVGDVVGSVVGGAVSAVGAISNGAW